MSNICAHTQGTHTQRSAMHTCSHVHLTALCTEAQTATDPHRPEKKAESNILGPA